MQSKEIICLANSVKSAGHCLAGIATDGSGWIRPLGSGEHGAITFVEQWLSSGESSQLLHVIRLPLNSPAPEAGQPENWSISPTEPWTLARSTLTGADWHLIANSIDHDPWLLRSEGRSIPRSTVLREREIAKSLALVEPQNIRWNTNARSRYGKRRVDCSFDLNGRHFDGISLTDPVWESKLLELAPEIYPHAALQRSQNRTLLTVSMTPEFRQEHFKLVAGVISLPL